MNEKLDLLAKLLTKFVNNLTDEELKTLLEGIAFYNEDRLNKVEACKFLNMSRATFDRKVKLGELPKGRKVVGLKEKLWSKKSLSKFIHSKHSK